MTRETKEWLKISFAFGIGNYQKWQYIDIDDPLGSMEKVLSNSALQDKPFVRAYKSLSSDTLDRLLELCERQEISILTPDSEDYPHKLRFIDNPPVALFVLGDVECLNSEYSAAIVGARRCSNYSSYAAERLSFELAQKGVSIVSGFARGIDSAAHGGALRANGSTIAVLGNGILYDYPKGTMPFKREISKSGAVISEYLPASTPLGDNFKMRNRIISGLSDCVIVAEAGEKSGSLNTANHAADQGRELFVIPPPNIFDRKYSGQSGLLRDGAQPALSSEDIFFFLSDD